MEPWYILINGSALEGNSLYSYAGRTTSREEALKFLRSKEGEHFTGGVHVVTDKGTHYYISTKGFPRKE